MGPHTACSLLVALCLFHTFGVCATSKCLATADDEVNLLQRGLTVSNRQLDKVNETRDIAPSSIQGCLGCVEGHCVSKKHPSSGRIFQTCTQCEIGFYDEPAAYQPLATKCTMCDSGEDCTQSDKKQKRGRCHAGCWKDNQCVFTNWFNIISPRKVWRCADTWEIKYKIQTDKDTAPDSTQSPVTATQEDEVAKEEDEPATKGFVMEHMASSEKNLRDLSDVRWATLEQELQGLSDGVHNLADKLEKVEADVGKSPPSTEGSVHDVEEKPKRRKKKKTTIQCKVGDKVEAVFHTETGGNADSPCKTGCRWEKAVIEEVYKEPCNLCIGLDWIDKSLGKDKKRPLAHVKKDGLTCVLQHPEHVELLADQPIP